MSLRHLKSTQSTNNLLDSGRESLSTILKIINESDGLYNQLLIPNVICNDIIPIIQSYGLTIKYYPVDNKLRPDFNYIEGLTSIQMKKISGIQMVTIIMVTLDKAPLEGFYEGFYQAFSIDTYPTLN